MRKYISTITIVLLLLGSSVFAQDYTKKKYIDSICKKYQKELNLSVNQNKEFYQILIKTNDKLAKIIISDKRGRGFKINKIVKSQDLEVFALVSRLQFDKYKKVKKIIESHKKYRM